MCALTALSLSLSRSLTPSIHFTLNIQLSLTFIAPAIRSGALILTPFHEIAMRHKTLRFSQVSSILSRLKVIAIDNILQWIFSFGVWVCDNYFKMVYWNVVQHNRFMLIMHLWRASTGSLVPVRSHSEAAVKPFYLIFIGFFSFLCSYCWSESWSELISCSGSYLCIHTVWPSTRIIHISIVCVREFECYLKWDRERRKKKLLIQMDNPL